MVINYNTLRDPLERGEPRANELRISNVGSFYRNIGFISNPQACVNCEDNILDGVKNSILVKGRKGLCQIIYNISAIAPIGITLVEEVYPGYFSKGTTYMANSKRKI